MKNILQKLKKFWNWIWNSDSILSWIVALILIFIIVKYIFFPVLGLTMGTSLPLAGVESSSMDHQIVRDDTGILNLCGKPYTKDSIEYKNFNEYWEICGEWYEQNNISKQEFSEFPLKNGFKKGDIVVVWGRFQPEVGDIIIFKPNPESKAPRPIVHRIVKITQNSDTNELILETKGDHNKEQLTVSNNLYQTDETLITEDRIIGKVIFKIPYLGWLKIWFVEILGRLVG